MSYPLGQNVVMKYISNLIKYISNLAGKRATDCPPAPAEQLQLELARPTASGLPLREAMAVRSAELWLQLGQPDSALAELQDLPPAAQGHPWTRRVSFDAAVAQLHQSSG